MTRKKGQNSKNVKMTHETDYCLLGHPKIAQLWLFSLIKAYFGN